MPVESVDNSVSIADRGGLSTFDKHLFFYSNLFISNLLILIINGCYYHLLTSEQLGCINI